MNSLKTITYSTPLLSAMQGFDEIFRILMMILIIDGGILA